MMQARSIGTSYSLKGLQGPLSINTSGIPHPAPLWEQAAEVTLCFLTPEQLKQGRGLQNQTPFSEYKTRQPTRCVGSCHLPQLSCVEMRKGAGSARAHQEPGSPPCSRSWVTSGSCSPQSQGLSQLGRWVPNPAGLGLCKHPTEMGSVKGHRHSQTPAPPRPRGSQDLPCVRAFCQEKGN